MADRLIIYAGAGIPDATHPTSEDNQGIGFFADGVEHICGWTIPVPATLRGLNTLMLRLGVIDPGTGPGNVKFVVTYASAGDNTGILSTSTEDVIVPIPNIAATLVVFDLNVGLKIPSNATLFFLSLNRNSSDPLDTFANDIFFMGGRTLDI